MPAERCSASCACACRADEPLLRQGGLATNPGDGLALPRDGRREPRRAGARRLAGAVEPVALRGEIDPELGEPLALLGRFPREPLVLRRRAGETVDARHDLLERGRAEDHRDRIGLTLDVELLAGARAIRRCDASSERRTISVRSVASASAWASSLERASRRACSACARASDASAAYSCRSAADSELRSAPACLARLGPVCAAPTVGIDPVKRMPLRRAAPSSGHVEVGGLTRRRP